MRLSALKWHIRRERFQTVIPLEVLKVEQPAKFRRLGLRLDGPLPEQPIEIG